MKQVEDFCIRLCYYWKQVGPVFIGFFELEKKKKDFFLGEPRACFSNFAIKLPLGLHAAPICFRAHFCRAVKKSCKTLDCKEENGDVSLCLLKWYENW